MNKEVSDSYFRFKQFTINQAKSVFKVGTDGVLLGACAELYGAQRILDVGTGTGLIAIMVAQRSEAKIVALEPEINSFNEACENAAGSKWSDRISILNTGIQNYRPVDNLLYDIIITNPPYFKNSLRNPDTRKSLTRHDDSLSSSELLEGTTRLLSDSGSLQLILPYTEGTLFIAEASTYELFCNRIIKVKPKPSGEIIRLIMKFERRRRSLYEKFLTIETGIRHNYTEEYREIMREFYLNF